MDNKATTNPLFTFHSKSLVSVLATFRFFSSMLRYFQKNYFSRHRAEEVDAAQVSDPCILLKASTLILSLIELDFSFQQLTFLLKS